MISILEKPELRRRAAPITLKQYHLLVESGAVDRSLELMEGVLVEKMPKSPMHRYLVRMIQMILGKNLPEGVLLFQEQPISIPADNSEPEPDLAVIEGTDEDFIDSHPLTARLVVEVALTSLAVDQEKASLYAKAGVNEYLICDGTAREFLRFSKIKDGAYTVEERFEFSEKLSLLEFPEVSFALADFWPKKTLPEKG